jgi:DNA invertase Pin-like site-specific DNA recombinase
LSEETIVIGIYLRVSTKSQETKSQKHAIDRWIKSQGYPKAELVWYEDKGISGKTTSRPAFQKMMGDVRANKITKLITFEISRLSRDFMDTLTIMQSLSENGVEVEVPDQGVVGFQDSMAKFMVSAKALVASQEREQIGRRIKEGLAAAKKSGTRSGKPIGAPKNNKYRNGKTKRYDPVEIDRLIRLSKKLTCSEIASEMGWSASKVSLLQRKFCR